MLRLATAVGTALDAGRAAPSDERLLARVELPGVLRSQEFPVRRWPERRVVVLGSASLLLIGAFAASMVSKSALDALAVLYVVPVMLAGLELGVRAGLGGAAVAIVLLLVVSGGRSEPGTLGLAASSAVFLVAGALAGRFSERMRAARCRQERLLISGLRLARLEDLDTLPTMLVNELEQTLDLSIVEVELDGASEVVRGSVEVATGERLEVPITAHGIVFGSLKLGLAADRSFSPEDRVVAAKLALQAGVAAHNQRLLAAERERAALRAELESTRGRLADHLRNVSQILDSHEAERREIARQLHEQAAQAMAGVLMGLQVLQRDLDHELTRTQLDAVRDVTRETLADLRQLAVSVRPPSLDELGLRAALDGIAEREETPGARHISLRCEDGPLDLAPEVETCAYRVVEDAIEALEGSLLVHVSVDHDRARLRIELDGHRPAQPDQLQAKLATARARLELLEGTLDTSSNGAGAVRVVAELPLHTAPKDLDRR